MANASSGTSSVTVEPAATLAPRPDLDGRDQVDVGADEGLRADRRLVLLLAVIVAGDRAGADVDVLGDIGVADVGEVVDLRAEADLRGLDLGEVADARAGRSSSRGGCGQTARPRSSRNRRACTT